MNLLVLGGNGFLGRAVVAEAVERGHDVTTPPGESRAHAVGDADLLELAAGAVSYTHLTLPTNREV